MSNPPNDSENQLSFEEYVALYCPNTNIDDANEFAYRGGVLLAKINAEEPVNGDRADDIAYLNWYLIKHSFINGEPFGKGMFALKMKDEEATRRLYDYFKNERRPLYSAKSTEENRTGKTRRAAEPIAVSTYGFAKLPVKAAKKVIADEQTENPTYSRASSHFNDLLVDRSEGHFGIDASRSYIPMPVNFKTTAFALCQREDENTPFLYVKPETEGSDALRDPVGTTKHGMNFLKATEASRMGLKRYDEKKGEELRILISEDGRFTIDKSNFMKVSANPLFHGENPLMSKSKVSHSQEEQSTSKSDDENIAPEENISERAPLIRKLAKDEITRSRSAEQSDQRKPETRPKATTYSRTSRKPSTTQKDQGDKPKPSPTKKEKKRYRS